MNQKISVKRLGKKWVAFHYVFIAVWMVLTCVFLFVSDVQVHSFMLLNVTPIAMVAFLVYFTLIIYLNMQEIKKEADRDNVSLKHPHF